MSTCQPITSADRVMLHEHTTDVNIPRSSDGHMVAILRDIRRSYPMKLLST